MPGVFEEVSLVSLDRYLPEVLARRRIGACRCSSGWCACSSIPVCYRLIGMLSRLAGRGLALVWRGRAPGGGPVDLLPGPVRLLLLAIAVRWLVSRFELSLIERQFWAAAVRHARARCRGLAAAAAERSGRAIRPSKRCQPQARATSTALLRMARRALTCW